MFTYKRIFAIPSPRYIEIAKTTFLKSHTNSSYTKRTTFMEGNEVCPGVYNSTQAKKKIIVISHMHAVNIFLLTKKKKIVKNDAAACLAGFFFCCIGFVPVWKKVGIAQ